MRKLKHREVWNTFNEDHTTNSRAGIRTQAVGLRWPRSCPLDECMPRTIPGAWNELRSSSPSLINLWQVGLRLNTGVKTAPSWNVIVPSLPWSRESSIDPIRLQRAESGKVSGAPVTRRRAGNTADSASYICFPFLKSKFHLAHWGI